MIKTVSSNIPQRFGYSTMRELLLTKSNNEVILKPNLEDKRNMPLLAASEQKFSVELSPNSDFNANLLSKINPRFCSVTWLGPTDSSKQPQEIPAVVLSKNLHEHGFKVMVHLTGRNLNVQSAKGVLNELKNVGVDSVLALQGDWMHVLEKDDTKCDFPYASNFVSFIKKEFDNYFTIGVTGYPQRHPNSESEEEEFKYLNQKVSSGADFIITQATFNYDDLDIFVKTCRSHNIRIPIIPGIFIISSYKTLVAMIKHCQLKVPKNIMDSVEAIKDNQKAVEEFGLNLAIKMIKKILANDLFNGVHFFTLNNLEQVEKVINELDDGDAKENS